MMHPDTLAELRRRLLAETAGDRAYDGLGWVDITARLNAPVVVAEPATYRNVLISDVEGYLEGQLAMQPLIDWIEQQVAPSHALTIAKTLRRVMEGGRLDYFLTADPVRRANVLGMFQVLAATPGTGVTDTHAQALADMTVAPPGAPEVTPTRWGVLVEGLPGIDGHPGPPNSVTADLVGELLNADG